MKKFLLSLAVVLATVSASAQTFAPKAFTGKLGVQTTQAPKALKAPAKASLADNQRLVGYYTTDDAYQYGLGVGSYCTGEILTGVYLEPSDYSQYYGAKAVGMRFYLPEGTAAGVEVYTVQSGSTSMTLAASKTETISKTGWNTVLFDEPFVLSSNTEAIMVCAVLNQTSSNYPIGFKYEDLGREMYIYCNIPSNYGGSGEGWCDMGSSYTLTNQLILESDNFPTNGVVPADFGKFTVALGGTKDIKVTLNNAGASLKNFSYTITQEGQTSEEKTVTLASALGVGGNTTVTIPFSAASKTGTYPTTLTVTKVNGVANELTNNTATGTNITLSKILPKTSVVEEITGTGCGNCPRGHVGMSLLRNKFGDQFIGVAMHYYNSSDAMYNGNHPSLGFSGAPQCMINRDGNAIDPYYGSSNDVRDDFAESLENAPMAGVTVSGVWNADGTEVTATANVESLTDATYEMVYYLVADSLSGTTSAWKQSNYYNGYSASQIGDENLNFLGSAGSSYAANYNDVMISSSYSGTVNQAASLEVAEEATKSATYTLTMPTRSALLKAIKTNLVYVVALVCDSETGEVINAAKGTIAPDPTGIQGVTTNGNATVVARYNAAGQQIAAPQQGLNIVKMSDGTIRKVMVK